MYKLRAGAGYVANNTIYDFQSWSGTDVEFPNGNTSRTVNVVFISDTPSVTANYAAVNNTTNYTMTISSDDTLVIPSGSTISFADIFSLNIEGSIIADGTSNAITFTGPGRDATIDYNGVIRPPEPTSWFITINGNNAMIDFKNVTIENNYGGISINDFSSATLEDVTISGTNQAVSIGKLDNDDIIFSNMHITNSTNGVVFPSEFESVSQESHLLMFQCVFSNIDDYGIFIFQEVQSTTNSDIYLTIGHCTFYNVGNSTTHGGNSIYTNDLAGTSYADIILDIQASIFSNTTLLLVDDAVTLTEYVNLLHGCQNCSQYLNNNMVSGDPLFSDPSNNNYQILVGSPAIDAGVDDFCLRTLPDYDCYEPFLDAGYFYDEDPDFTIPDIGAYYYDHVPSPPTNLILSGGFGASPQLSWTVSPDADINKYYIYRKQNTNGSYINIGNTSGTSFTDTDIIIGPPMATWYYYVKAKDNVNQYSQPSNTVSTVGMLKQLIQSDIIPDNYSLSQNHPNPFNPKCSIQFGLPEYSRVSLNIYNALGQLIATPLYDELSAGFKVLHWNGNDNNGNPVASGVYLYAITATSLESDKVFTDKKKMILMK